MDRIIAPHCISFYGQCPLDSSANKGPNLSYLHSVNTQLKTHHRDTLPYPDEEKNS